jgi:RNA polymerase sigma-70 factor, ECF subfamily
MMRSGATARHDDRALARAMADGDRAAIERFHARYADALFAFIVHRAGLPRADAEDIWQESLLAAMKTIGAYRGESALFSWVCGIARHKLLDRLRDASAWTPQPDAGAQADLALLIDGGPLPDAALQRRDTKALVVEALMRLPDEYRRALVARYADEQSVGDVAVLLGRSYKATESLLSRARAAFREAMHECPGEPTHAK